MRMLFVLQLIFSSGLALSQEPPPCTILLEAKILSQKDQTPLSLWLPFWQRIETLIENLNVPLAHGTTSFEFEKIIKDQGLVAGQMPDAYAPLYNSLSDLRSPDGLLASYGFAVRDQWQTMAFHAYPTTRRDLIERYAQTNKTLQGIRGFFLKMILRKIASDFSKTRRQEGSFPIYLVFEGDGLNPLEYPRKEVIPSEIRTQEKVNLNALRLILTPAAKIDEIKSMISDLNPDWPVFPIELIELYEIQLFSNVKKDR